MQGTLKHVASLFMVALPAAFIPGLALAYVGPGAGISMLGAFWGLVVGIVMALGVILFWPIRMMMRKRKAAREEAENNAGGETAQTEAANSTATDDNVSA